MTSLGQTDSTGMPPNQKVNKAEELTIFSISIVRKSHSVAYLNRTVRLYVITKLKPIEVISETVYKHFFNVENIKTVYCFNLSTTL